MIRMWCSDGIETNHLGDGRIRCVVSHFTSFAVLVSPGGVHGGVPLKVVSYIGCVVSIVCLTLAIIIMVVFRYSSQSHVVLYV